MRAQAEAFFLPAEPTGSGQRFCLFYPAQRDPEDSPARGQILYIHPFAEEMNKARRMAALQARALAQAGFDVVQVDLLGCGDSSGDFGDATWQRWSDDVLRARHWLRCRDNGQGTTLASAPLWLWGLRAGCLLAAEAAGRLNEPCNFLFWQPPTLGKPLLQQFLRLKAAGDLLGGQAKGVMEVMRRQLADGAATEITGYTLSPELAKGLAEATLAPPLSQDKAQRLVWFDISTRQDASASPASASTIGQWQQAGFHVESHMVRGPAFWQTTEIEEAPALLAATTAALSRIPA